MNAPLTKIALLFLVIISAMGCAAADPSANDLKSPCVSNDSISDHYTGMIPCVRRKPLENYVA